MTRRRYGKRRIKADDSPIARLAKAEHVASRHRLDSGSADKVRDYMRPMGASPVPQMPSTDGPRGDGELAKRYADDGRPVDPKVECLDFGEALGVIRRGGRVARSGWNGKGQYIALAFGTMFAGPSIADNGHAQPCIVMQPVSGPLVAWTASQTDLLARDWCLVREEKVLVYGSGAEA